MSLKMNSPEEEPKAAFRPEQGEILKLLDVIIPFQIEQQEEVAALDLLYECDMLDRVSHPFFPL